VNVAAQVAARRDWPTQTRGPLPAGEPGPTAAAFPAGPRQVLVEMFLGGGWVDVTSYVYSRDPVSISRGLSAEASVTDPATLSLTLNNRDGRFASRNPTGPYYGLLTRNTPIRVKVAGWYAAGWRSRFWGEVSSWPQKWDPSGADGWVPLEAAGVLRRLGQGETAARSSLYRRTVRLPTPAKAYWPMEDAAGSTSLASGVGGDAMTLSGTPSLAAFSDFYAADAVPTVESATLTGRVPVYVYTSGPQLRFLLFVPAGGTVNGAVLVRLRCTGTLVRWDIIYGTGGTLTAKAYDATDTLVTTSGTVSNIDGVGVLVALELDLLPPAAVNFRLKFYRQDTGALTSTGVFTEVSATVGVVSSVVVNPAGAALTGVAIGHVAVQTEALYSAGFLSDTPELATVATSQAGETAAARMLRLGVEEGLPVRIVGDPAGTAAMGAQRPDTLLALLRECATTDAGLLFEPRDEGGLAYRTRESLYNRAAGLTVDYPSHQLSAIEPVDDDRYTRNDVTVTRRGGSSAHAVAETGPLSVQPPPAGAGRYTQSTDVNTRTDAVLPDHAGWRLHLGTVDEPRYPAVTLDLASPALAGVQALSEAVLDLDVGSRLVVTGPPAWLPPDDISTGVQGLTETIGTFEHTIGVSTVPESPYHVGVYDQDASRYASAGSTLVAALSTGTTPFQVSTPSGPLWSDADGDFDIMVGGERMRVAIISPVSATVQSFDVERSVNGVNKAHSAGETVELFRPVFFSI